MIKINFADAITWKWHKVGDRIEIKNHPDGSFTISEWNLKDGTPIPNEVEILQAIDEFNSHKISERQKMQFVDFTEDQFLSWVDSNVTDLASARAAIKQLGKILLRITRKIGL